jgi:C-terminal processing protease CtpA/Prc
VKRIHLKREIWSLIWGAPEGSLVTIVEEDEYQPKSPNRGYHGHVIVLINGFTCSAASHFAHLIKAHNLGTVVGLESGQRNGENFGETMLINLPHTNLPVKISTAFLGNRNFDTIADHGVLPDKIIERDITQEINNIDSQLEQAKGLFVSKSRQKISADGQTDSQIDPEQTAQ